MQLDSRTKHRRMKSGKRQRKFRKRRKRIFSSSSSPATSADIDFTGKTVTHTWNENGARFLSLFCTNSTFVWNDLTDPFNIVTGEEKYTRKVISDDVVQYSWKESPLARDYGIAWTFNVNTGMVYGIIVNFTPEENLDVEGTYEVDDTLELSTVFSGLRGC